MRNCNHPARAERGRLAEQEAEQYLTRQGLTLRERNYRCKLGEIDLIMADRDTLVFVEVRLRTHHAFASAAESVDYRKQQKLLRAARHYLLRTGLTDKVNGRFDVVAINPRSDNGESIIWLKDAFGAT
ncbi:YraN family protein [Marinimicrobium sp. ARAG 43.8]|uniref:YraN family protein n=1 Tax=Marinimicrobium sp. ARAG 43.8 TaxID=3418719 RepID=UPI003CFB3E60